jgi:hypothetical protein
MNTLVLLAIVVELLALKFANDSNLEVKASFQAVERIPNSGYVFNRGRGLAPIGVMVNQ